MTVLRDFRDVSSSITRSLSIISCIEAVNLFMLSSCSFPFWSRKANASSVAACNVCESFVSRVSHAPEAEVKPEVEPEIYANRS